MAEAGMKVAIATTGRFHVLDLARELAALGHEAAFYSLVPKRRTMRFGLPGEFHHPLLAQAVPWLAIQRFGPSAQRKQWDRRLLERMDGLIARRLEPCDAFIGMSGLCVESAKTAKEKYGARIFIERGSRHILSQKQILDELAAIAPQTETVPAYAVERELASYELADVVVVPSQHVVESFLELGFPKERLFKNPYGVDLTMFQLTPAPAMDPPVIVHVGAWSMRKGCDVLVEAFKRLNMGGTLLHLGAIVDAPVPEAPFFVHHEPVPQWRLQEFYAKAHVLALASREDGFGMVLSQALACGVPVVCTNRTGGSDLKSWLREPKAITVVKTDDAGGLAKALKDSLQWSQSTFPSSEVRDLTGDGRNALSWRAYGERYNHRLLG